MSDIVKRLNSYADWFISCALGNVPDEAQMCMDAATEITHLRAELANARNAVLEEAIAIAEAYEGKPCGAAQAWTEEQRQFFDAGQLDASISIAHGIRALKAEGESR